MGAANCTRRRLLATGLLASAVGTAPAWGKTSTPRVAALDWGLASTVAALGAGPLAVGERASYSQWVREPALPPDTIELGLRTNPSFETLAALKPDLILVNALNTGMSAQLESIAPTYANMIYAEERQPLARAFATARALGAKLGRPVEADALSRLAEARLDAARDRMAGRQFRPQVPLGFIDDRHLRVYGAGSLFADVMDRIGLTSGWTQPTNLWGFSVVAVEALAVCGTADFLVIEPVPGNARRALAEPGLWSSLVADLKSRVTALPPVWAFGDLTAAARCAAVLADALATTPEPARG